MVDIFLFLCPTTILDFFCFLPSWILDVGRWIGSLKMDSIFFGICSSVFFFVFSRNRNFFGSDKTETKSEFFSERPKFKWKIFEINQSRRNN